MGLWAKHYGLCEWVTLTGLCALFHGYLFQRKEVQTGDFKDEYIVHVCAGPSRLSRQSMVIGVFGRPLNENGKMTCLD